MESVPQAVSGEGTDGRDTVRWACQVVIVTGTSLTFRVRVGALEAERGLWGTEPSDRELNNSYYLDSQIQLNKVTWISFL